MLPQANDIQTGDRVRLVIHRMYAVERFGRAKPIREIFGAATLPPNPTA
jgi:hypothetical protein